MDTKKCSKMAYQTKAEANADIKQLKHSQRRYTKANRSKFSSKTNKKYYPYECPTCGLWHLTTIKPRHFKKIASTFGGVSHA